MSETAEIDINLTPSVGAYGYVMELSFSDPDDQGRHPSQRGFVQFDIGALRARQGAPAAYGKLLCETLFSDPNLKGYFNEVRGVAEKTGKKMRLRLTVNKEGNASEKTEVEELFALRWETLRDPRDGSWLLTKEDVFFSRFLSSLDWKPVLARTSADLRGLIVVSGPKQLREGKVKVNQQALDPINVERERERAENGLKKIALPSFLVSDENHPGQVTLENLVRVLKDGKGYDVLYLVCHGRLLNEPPAPFLLLEDEHGNAVVTPAAQLIDALRDLPYQPRLVVLLSCQSGGKGSDAQGALSALGPALAEAGVPAVIAMQGDISMETGSPFMETFFEELAVDGQIDRAVAAARGVVRGRPDCWMPVLFMRLKNGRLWDEERAEERKPQMAPQAAGYLIGRADSLKKLKQRLLNSPGNLVTVLMQFPGIGKTELAATLANDEQIRKHYRDGILWAPLGKKPDMTALLSEWAEELGINTAEMNTTGLASRLRVMLRHISQKHMLLIVDDAWRKEHVAPFRELLSGGDLLVTTRSIEVASDLLDGEGTEENGLFKLSELNEDEGVNLLAWLAPNAIKKPGDIRLARKLVHEVGALPLALVLMGRYLVGESLSGQPRRISEALAKLQERRRLFDLKISHLPGRPEDMPSTLRAAIDMSVEDLDDAARHALGMLCVFRPKPYRFSASDAAGAFEIEYSCLSSLVDAGLLEFIPGSSETNESSGDETGDVEEEEPEEYFRIQRTVADYVLDQLSEEQIQERHQKAVDYFASLLRSYEEERAGDSTPYERAYSYENRQWQQMKASWLYHQSQTTDRTEANLNLAQIYFDVFWWWRCYNEKFPFCDQLFSEWQDTQTSEDDQKWLQLLARFQAAYPTGFEKQGKGDWKVVEDTLHEIRRMGRLDENLEDLEDDPQRMHVRAITNFFLAESYRYRSTSDLRADRYYNEAVAIIQKKLYEDDDDWNLPWAYWHQADLMLERGVWQNALDLAAKSLALVGEMDLLDRGRDNELVANNYRVRADVCWGQGKFDLAFQNYALAAFYAYLFQALPKAADFYTLDFYIEMMVRTCRRLVELWNGGQRDASLLACHNLRQFWRSYWERNQASLAAVNFELILEEANLLDLERSIFPRRPSTRDMQEESGYVQEVLTIARDMKGEVEKMR